MFLTLMRYQVGHACGEWDLNLAGDPRRHRVECTSELTAFSRKAGHFSI